MTETVVSVNAEIITAKGHRKIRCPPLKTRSLYNTVPTAQIAIIIIPQMMDWGIFKKNFFSILPHH